MPTAEDILTQARDFQTKALDRVEQFETTVVEYVGKAISAFADVVPEDRPEVVGTVLESVVYQAGFAKKVLDSQNEFAKKLIDVSVKPLVPAKKRTVKAA